jgi:hypothetical protein
MKLVTFRDQSGAERAGALYAEGARIADLALGYQSLAGAPAPALASLQSLIEGGVAALDLARRALDHVARSSAPAPSGAAAAWSGSASSRPATSSSSRSRGSACSAIGSSRGSS